MEAQGDTLKERVLLFIASIGLTKAQFEKVAGLSNGFVDKCGDNTRITSLDKISNKFPQLNMTWLRTGEGPMLKPQPSEAANVPGQDEFHTDTSTAAITVPMLPLAAAAGTLSDFSGTALPYQCEMIISPIRGAEMAIKVSGESMAPEIPNGSQILIKRIDEKAFIEWGRIYVLDTRNGAVVKRIMPSDRDGAVKCVSVNPEFPPFDVSFTDIFGVYRVLMCMSLK